MKIETLTPEQSARFEEWSKKWIEIGLSTEPANFEKATAAALRAYKLINKDRPMVVLRMGSPYAANVGGALALNLLRTLPNVWSQVRSQVGSQVESQVGSAVYNYRGGSFWAGWCAYISFMRDVLGWSGDTLSKFEIDEDLAKSCGWVWWHENVLAISDRPSEIHRDQQGRLHGEKGPSIAYRDGWSLYHWHGTAIPAEWVTGKPPTATEAISWSNIEQRRAACEIVGWRNILNQLDAKIIDADGDEEIGTLLEANIPDSGLERFLQVRCGTGRDFVLPVPRDMQTAIQANAWTYGLNPSDFKPEIRT